MPPLRFRFAKVGFAQFAKGKPLRHPACGGKDGKVG